MSFEIYVMSTENVPLDLATFVELQAAFGGAASVADDGLLKLTFDTDFCDCRYTLGDDGRVLGFTIFRPLKSDTLWSGLFSLLSRFHYFAVWPGDCGPLVIRADTTVDPGILELLGPTVTVSAPSDIPALIAGSHGG